MVTLRDTILETRKRQRRDLESNRQVVRAVLVAIDYADKPDVAGRPGYVWVREYGANGGVFQALNTKVQNRLGLTVQLAVDPKVPFTRRILGVDESILVNLDTYTGSPYLPNHHADHEWPGQASGPDAVHVYPRALVPLRTQSGSGLTVNVACLVYAYNGARKIFQGYTGYDISGHKPAAGQALYVLIYLNPATNALGATAGTATTDSPTVIPTLPAFTAGTIPSAFVRLDGDQTSITEADIVDARLFIDSCTEFAFATPSITLGAAAAAGSANTVIRSDATIAAFDATNPSTQAFGDSPVVGTAAYAAHRDHKHGMPSQANPTATVGLTTVDGSAATSMRSDAAPALAQSIAPTWTGKHIWNPSSDATDVLKVLRHSDSAVVFQIDTTNKRIGLTASAPADTVDTGVNGFVKCAGINFYDTVVGAKAFYWHLYYSSGWKFRGSPNTAQYGGFFGFYADTGKLSINTTSDSGLDGAAATLVERVECLAATGYWGFGNVSPTYRLQIPTTASAAGTGYGYAWTATSDKRIKSQIKPIRYGLAEILKLNPVSYFFNNTHIDEEKGIQLDSHKGMDDQGAYTIGLIAQEVLPIIPEVVCVPEDENKSLWGLDYDKLAPVFVKAIQELTARIKVLEAR